MPPIMQFAKRAFEYCTWRGLLSPQIVTSLMKDEQESEFTALDDVLKKYTGVLADNLKGATFVAINDRGEFHTCQALSIIKCGCGSMGLLKQIRRDVVLAILWLSHVRHGWQ